MGIYLSTPSTEMSTETGHENGVKFAVGEIQGWRKNMEDAHIAIADLNTIAEEVEDSATPVSLFGVFDGHGGKEVAKFTRRFYSQLLVQLDAYKDKDFENALRQSFHTIDETLEDPKYDSFLKELRALPNPSDIIGHDSMDEGDSTHTNRLHALDRYPPLKVVEAKKVIDEISEGSNSEINSDNSNTRSKDDMYKELLGNNKDNKSITTSQAIDLIRNILNTAESKRGSTPPISPSNGNNDDSEKDNNFGDLDSDRDCRSTKVCLAENKNDSEVAKYDHKIEGRSAKATAKDAKFQDDSDILYDDNIIIKDVKDSSVNGVNVNSLTIDTKNNASEKIESSLFNKSDRPDIAPPASIETASGITCNLKDHRVLAGCTAIVALKHGNKLYVANAGDSRGVLCRKDGVAFALSEDHKPQQDIEKNRIVGAGGFVNAVGRINGNLNLSRSLGDLKYKQLYHLPPDKQIITAEPDITVTTIEDTDRFFVLACDGIWDCMTNQGICDFISKRLDKGMDVLEIVNEIFKECVSSDPRHTAGIGGDNMTCLIVLLNQ